jgi:hypothetical protein
MQGLAVQGPAVKDPAVKDPAVRDPAVRDPAVKDPAVQGPAARRLRIRRFGSKLFFIFYFVFVITIRTLFVLEECQTNKTKRIQHETECKFFHVR